MRTSDDMGLIARPTAGILLGSIILASLAVWGWVGAKEPAIEPATPPAAPVTSSGTERDRAYINGIYDGIKLAVFFEGVDLGLTGDAALARSAKLCGHYTVERALADVVEHGMMRGDAVELGISVAIVTKAACTPKDRKRA